jgi:hypothetical protein
MIFEAEYRGNVARNRELGVAIEDADVVTDNEMQISK